jgi:hypothetical protein
MPPADPNTPPIDTPAPKPAAQVGRWLLGLALPPCAVALVALALFYAENTSHYFSTTLGSSLLQDNAQRPRRGTIWQGILAAQRSRATLVSPLPVDSLAAPTAGPPPALERTTYRLVHRTDDFALLRAAPRNSPWRPDSLDASTLKDLAVSTQVFHQGVRLMHSIDLPLSTYRTQARIHAEVALEEGRLFSLLHHRLSTAQSPLAYDFIRMSATDQSDWRQRLEPLIAVYGSPEGTSDTTKVQGIAYKMMDTWADSLQRGDLDRLRHLWQSGAPCEIRLLRYMDGFRGYFQPKGEHPYRFDIAAKRQTAAQALLGQASP